MRAEGSKGRLHRARLWVGLSVDAVTRGLAERRAERSASKPGHRMLALAAEWRQAVRALASRPGFAAIVIALLGLAMGANAAVFGVVNATLLRPLPFNEPERLVVLWESYAPMHMDTMPWSDPDYTSVRSASAFEGTAIFAARRFVLTGRGEPAAIRAAVVENTMFTVLGTNAAQGRVFSAADRNHVVVLSHKAWADRFNRDPAIVGQSILLDNEAQTVIGVLPAGVSFPPPITFSGQMMTSDPEIYVPYEIDTAPETRGSHHAFAIARLRPGATVATAQDEVTAIATRLEREFPNLNTSIRMHVDSLHGQSVMTIRSVLFLLLAAVGGVLLIASASISNLMLARASGRTKEMALRAALGASRASLVRQLLFESAILGAGGIVVGLLSAQWMSSALLSLNPIELPEMFRPSLDWRVLAFTIGATLIAVFAFGLIPALAGSRTDLVSILQSGIRTTVGRGERRTKAALVVLQVSLAVVLLVGSGLMIRSLMRLWSVDPGFRAEGIVTVPLDLPDSRYPDEAKQRAFQERWLTRAGQIPGVTGVAALTMLPFAFDKSSSDYSVAGEPPRTVGDYLIATYNYVSPTFAEVLHMPVIEGRPLAASDTAGAPLVVLVSESLARRHWPGGGAVGHQLLFGDDEEGKKPKTIVGVVGDVRMEGFDAPVAPTIFVPQSQSPVDGFWTALTTTRDPDAIASEIRSALREVDPLLPTGKIRPLTAIMGDTVKKPRFTAVVLSAFAMVALLIAAIGLYGVLSFDVAQQRRELGVRVALGATPQGIRSLVLTRGFRLVAMGLAAGIVVALACSRFIAGMLFNAPAIDVVSLLAAGGVLGLTTLIATWLPARRATKADPIEALRAQ
jgi:predicted permease